MPSRFRTSPPPLRLLAPTTRFDPSAHRGKQRRAIHLDIYRYGYILHAWHEQRRPQMRSMPWQSHGGGRCSTASPAAGHRRRQIPDVRAGGEQSVNALVAQLGLAQPQVSKHLRVLRHVGAVAVRGDGRRRLYRLNGEALKPIHDWVRAYEETWSERFNELDVVLDELKEKEEGDDVDR